MYKVWFGYIHIKKHVVKKNYAPVLGELNFYSYVFMYKVQVHIKSIMYIYTDTRAIRSAMNVCNTHRGNTMRANTISLYSKREILHS